MDKYQKYILKQIEMGKIFVFSHCCPIDFENATDLNKYGTFDESADTFNIMQDEDIMKTQYSLIIDMEYVEANPFEGIFVHKDNQWIEVPCVNKQYRILVDFNDKTDAIKFSFVNKIANDFILRVTYTEADKEQYYAKMAQVKKDALLATADIRVSTGSDLVNIYFQPCCDEYNHTEIILFVPKDYVTVGGPYGPVEKPSSWSLIKKCNVPTEDLFNSVNGLAYGTYAFILKQFDKNNQLLLETDYVEFSIKNPSSLQPKFGHINVI